MHDGCDVGHDLTGGWYDAGDFVKVQLKILCSTNLKFFRSYTWHIISWVSNAEKQYNITSRNGTILSTKKLLAKLT